MRVLILSYYFPPFNTIGAVRVGKTAKYLAAFGHDVRVVTASEQGIERTLPLEIPESHVACVSWPTLDRLPAMLFRKRRVALAQSTGAPAGAGSALAKLGRLARTVLAFPDEVAVGVPSVERAAGELIADWRPDVMFASATPVSVLILAHRLSRRFGVPWIGELRDLWSDNHAYRFPEWRRRLERRLERRVLASAAGLVTVSEPLAATLRASHGRPTIAVMNGFDSADYPATAERPPGASLTLLYTGQLFHGQDARPLVRAVALLSPEQRRRVRVQFVGKFLAAALGPTLALAEQLDVGECFVLRAPVSHREALRLQRQADVLVHFTWNDPLQTGLLSGKIFEYIGARRPILLVGATHTLVSEIVATRGLGVSYDQPEPIAAQLRRWLTDKARGGDIPDHPAAATAGLSREDQTRVLERFLNERLTART